MNDEQYRRLRDNHQIRGPRRLDEAFPLPATRTDPLGRPTRSPLANVIARAARSLHLRQAAQAAWLCIARDPWLVGSAVEAVEGSPAGGYTVVVAAEHAALAYDLRRQKATLQRQFAKLVPGVRSLVITVHDDGAAAQG